MFVIAAAFCAAASFPVNAQDKTAPDVLVLVDGERLVGKLQSAGGGNLVFRSNLAGEVTVKLSDVQELKSEGKFVVFAKGAEVHSAADAQKLPTGSISVADKKLEVKPESGQSQSMPVETVGKVMNAGAVAAAQKPASLFTNWHGMTNIGMAMQAATTDQRSINTGGFFSKDYPGPGWLSTRDRTTIDFFAMAMYIHKRFDDPARVFLYQANFVQEHYFEGKKTFLFAGASFEHNSTQGLELLQAYGGGVGYKFSEGGKHGDFEVRGGLGYMHQSFKYSPLDHNLIGSRFGQAYTKTFANGIVFSEQAGIRPAWNYSKAFFAGGNMSLTIPVTHHIGFTATETESFVNNPPPYRRKNSFQSTVGINIRFR